MIWEYNLNPNSYKSPSNLKPNVILELINNIDVLSFIILLCFWLNNDSKRLEVLPVPFSD